MAWGYSPYSEDFKIGDFLGSHWGAALRALMMLGSMGQGPMSGLEGMTGGMGGGQDSASGDGPPPPQVMQGMGQSAPQIQQPSPLAQGGPPMGLPGTPPMPGAPGQPQTGDMEMQKLMQMIQMLLSSGGAGSGGGMGF